MNVEQDIIDDMVREFSKILPLLDERTRQQLEYAMQMFLSEETSEDEKMEFLDELQDYEKRLKAFIKQASIKD
jgi:hypothetical protein